MKRSLPVLVLAALACSPAAVQSPAPYPTTPPEPGPARALRLPAPVERTLANGLRVIYVRQPELPLVHVTLIGRGGWADAPLDAAGIASFVADMIDEGAGGRDALELADAFEMLGASLRTYADWDAAIAETKVLSRALPDALALVADVAIRPNFPEEEVERLRQRRVNELSRARDEPTAVAQAAFNRSVYGAAHPYGQIATTTSTQAIRRADLVDFHRTYYRPGGAVLVLVGDVDPAAAHPAVERAFGGWAAGDAPGARRPLAPAIPGTRVVLIDKPGAAQSQVIVGHPGVARDHPDYFPLLVMNTLLGGSFTSRLNMNLRETKGYTYGAGSGFAMRLGAGPFMASAAIVTEKTDSALIEFFAELSRIRDEPVSGDELAQARSYMALGMPRRLETTGSVAQQLAWLQVYGIGSGFFERYVPSIMAVTAADVQRVAREHVRPGNAVVVVVGDLASIEPGVRALGLGPVEVRTTDDFMP